MNLKELFQFYEKLYFHEIDMREKINSRLQIPLAIIVAQISLISVLVKSWKNYELGWALISFSLLFAGSIILTGIALWFFQKSWYNYEYSFLPSAEETEKYRQELFSTYNEYEDTDKLVEKYLKQYIYNYYVECSTKNTINNDTRSINLHKTAKFIVISFVVSFVSILPFYFGQLNIEKENIVKVEIINQIQKGE